MDEVRLSIDTTNQAFDDFLDAASILDSDIVAGADSKQLETDKDIFGKARRELNSRLSIETPRLRQAMPLGAGGAFQLITSLTQVGASLITDCLNLGKVVDAPGANLNGKRIECRHDKTFSMQYADERILKVQLCVSEFYFAIRPSPFDDLHPEKIATTLSHAIDNLGAVCNGVTMFGLSYESTYGKREKNPYVQAN